MEARGVFKKLTRREYALIACGAGAAVLAGLPLALMLFGTAWRPGARPAEPFGAVAGAGTTAPQPARS